MRISDLQNGDVLLFEKTAFKRTFMDRLIKLFTGSKYIHCAVVVGDYQPLVAEQLQQVTCLPVPEFFRTHGGPIYVFRNPFVVIDPIVARRAALDRVGIKYGTAALLECAIQHTLGRFLPRRRPAPLFLSENAYHCTCSGLVAQIYAESAPTTAPTFTKYSTICEPDDFAAHGFREVGTLGVI